MGGNAVEEFNIYQDIAERTQGDIYIGAAERNCRLFSPALRTRRGLP
jgi:hypothetical protein